MKTQLIIQTSIGLLCLPAPAAEITFGTPPNQFTVDLTEIGDPGNPDDMIGSFPTVEQGGVGYTYYIGTYEISEDMVTKASAAGALGLDHDNRGANKPATGLTWNEAARFVNWLNTSQGHQPAYQFSVAPGDSGYDPNNNNPILWSSADAWQLDEENLTRHKDARYFIPNIDEWHKAAYYNGSVYFDYATGSDTLPTAVTNGTAPATAVHSQRFDQGPADIMDAGGLSPYGTMAQCGNAWEWSDSEVLASLHYGLLGGTWSHDGSSFFLSSSGLARVSTQTLNNNFGLRIATLSLPTPLAILNWEQDTGGDLELEFSSDPGVGYVIESSSNLASWTPMMSVTGDASGNATKALITPAGTEHFYRVSRP